MGKAFVLFWRWIFLGLTGLIGLIVGSSPVWAEQRDEQSPLILGVDLLPWVGVSTWYPERPRYLSLNLLAGISGGSRGLELGYIFNLSTGPVQGVQFAGGANVNAADFTGWQIAGGASVNGGRAMGLQVAGGANVNGVGAMGLLVAGGANVNGGRVLGASVAGGANVTLNSFQGLMMAGGANVVLGNVDGFRAAPGANFSGGDVRAVQFAVGANVTQGDFTGLQVAVANITFGRMRGIQLGLVNISQEANASIGLVNVHLKGYVQPEIYTSEEGLVMAGIRHGSGSFFNTYSLGKRLYGADIQWSEMAAAVGFGWRSELAENIDGSMELLATSIMQEPTGFYWTGDTTLLKVRPMLSFRMSEEIAIFGGPTITYRKASRSSGIEGPFAMIRLSDTWWAWPGVTLGMRLH